MILVQLILRFIVYRFRQPKMPLNKYTTWRESERIGSITRLHGC